MPRFEWMSLLEYTNWYHGCLHWKENTLRIECYNSDIASILPWLIHIWTLRTQTSKHTALPSVGQTITLRVCPPMAVQQIVHSRQCWTCFYNGINKPQIPRWLVSQRDTNKQTWVHAPQMFEQVINFVFSLCALCNNFVAWNEFSFCQWACLIYDPMGSINVKKGNEEKCYPPHRTAKNISTRGENVLNIILNLHQFGGNKHFQWISESLNIRLYFFPRLELASDQMYTKLQ